MAIDPGFGRGGHPTHPELFCKRLGLHYTQLHDDLCSDSIARFGNKEFAPGHPQLRAQNLLKKNLYKPQAAEVGLAEAVLATSVDFLFVCKRDGHITGEVENIVRRSGVKDGLCFVSPMHITAAVYVNDLKEGPIEDTAKWLEQLAPARPDDKHHRTGEDNGDAHLKSLLLHHETTLPVTAGKLDLGTWQRVFYAEFDGQRRRRVIVKVLGAE